MLVVCCYLFPQTTMFSPFARDLLRPQLFDRMDRLMKWTPHLVEDPWDDDYPKYNIFGNKTREWPSSKSKSFQLFLNANQFQPSDISIKIEDGYIVIHAKHDVNPDMHDYFGREFTRRCKIPDNVDPATLNSTFNKNGLLVVKANAKTTENPAHHGEVTIPVEIQGSRVDEGDLHMEKNESLKESDAEIHVSKEIH